MQTIYIDTTHQLQQQDHQHHQGHLTDIMIFSKHAMQEKGDVSLTFRCFMALTENIGAST
jgi:hypothetical protein